MSYDPRELREEATRLLAKAAAIEDGTWAVMTDGPVTPAELAKRIGCTLQGANNRLRKLYDLRLLDRKRVVVPGGGRKFEYIICR